MLSVTWDIPALAPVPRAGPAARWINGPHSLTAQQVYTGYTLDADSNPTTVPPWLPEIVLDDGKNTLLRFRGTLEGIRLPVVSGVQQNGSLALVHSRWYVRPEHGAWLYVQGLQPALRAQGRARAARAGGAPGPTPPPSRSARPMMHSPRVDGASGVGRAAGSGQALTRQPSAYGRRAHR